MITFKIYKLIKIAFKQQSVLQWWSVYTWYKKQVWDKIKFKVVKLKDTFLSIFFYDV